MKKSFLMVCIALMLALVCVACIACDPTTDDDSDKNSGLNDYETATYTVTFNVNSSDFKLENNTIKDVPAGSTISKPCDSNGKEIKPYKTGYTFKYWSADGTSEFDFSTDTINAPTTLTAIYTNNVYTHTVDGNSGGRFYIDKYLVVIQDKEGNVSYKIVDRDNGASVSSDMTLDLTYASTSNLACPTAKDGDKFLFWFYMKDGKPVQLTKVKTDGQSTVATLEKYSNAGYLDIYAMFESTLPLAEVVFNCDEDSTITEYFKVNETISTDAILDKSGNAFDGTVKKNGYIFDGWYYKVEDEDGEIEEIDFVFSTAEKDGTSLYSACSLSDYFTPTLLKLYPRWIKQIEIKSLEDYEDVYNTLHKENPTEDDLKKIQEILSADIKIDADIDFGGREFAPLFDENHVFTGTLDGGNHKLNNLKITHASQLSWLGCVTGEVKNVNIEMTAIPSISEEKYVDKITIAGIATQNSSRIENCDVVLKVDISGTAKALVIGGVVALNSGNSSVKNSGYISDCNVDLALVDCNCESLILGGVVAQGNSASTISNCTVKLSVNASCKNDGNASNGNSFAKIGGIMASNGGKIESCAVTNLLADIESRDEMYFGGICADNSGSIKKSYVDVQTINLKVGGGVSSSVCIGGLVGTNEGYIHNAYCNADIKVTSDRKNAIISIGGLVGNNISAKTDSSSSTTLSGVGAINCAYATGSIDFSAENEVSTMVYIGGIIGRNSASKLSSCFTLVDINVENGGTHNHIGNLLGSMERNASLGAGLQYTKENELKLNGQSVTSSTLVGESPQDTKDPFYGSATDYESMNITLDKEIWEFKEGELPKLI